MVTPATNSATDAVNNGVLHTKLDRIFSAPAEPVETVSYSMEIATKDDFDIGQLKRLTPQPVFCALPWILDDNLRYADDFLRAPTLQLTSQLRQAQYTVVNHVSCYNITEQQLDGLLSTGIQNLFVIRGDTVHGDQKFQHSAGLVQYLRSQQQQSGRPKLTIGVGGYPYGHHQSPSKTEELRYLKEKIDHGVDFLLTQTLYDAESFFRYREQCRAAGINIPVIPGIYVPHSYRHLRVMLNLTRITLSPTIDAAFAAHANDDPEQFETFAMEHFVGVLRELLESNATSNDPIKLVHFFSFNKFALLQKVLQKMNHFFH
ncbi:5,10-methylenetetrahydrofolate reductase [Anopheles moucheti]|uniref:5,10-methylenetetrahydrofolate reductase n=1 Tax=Anopheles moucheti TaxID=186751 RepID=UPI0022F072CA|nr:5,10-methylenetetrahydrofolate reductase [Anopheles moucheti]